MNQDFEVVRSHLQASLEYCRRFRMSAAVQEQTLAALARIEARLAEVERERDEHLRALEERIKEAEGFITKLAEGEAGCGCCSTWAFQKDAVAYCKTHGVPFKEET